MTNPLRYRKMVVRHVRRTSLDLLARLGEAGTATAHEAMGRRGSLGPHIRPIHLGARTAGNAVTVLCHRGDNMMLHAAIMVCREGDVLVVANTAPSTHGMFEELIATSLRTQGVDALVLDAGVRDTAELREMGFLVSSQHSSCQGAVRATAGSVNVPIVISRGPDRPRRCGVRGRRRRRRGPPRRGRLVPPEGRAAFGARGREAFEAGRRGSRTRDGWPA